MFDKKAYDMQYIKNSCDVINILLPKGKKAELKELAQKNGKSLSKLIIEAIEKQYSIQLARKKSE